MRRLHLDLIYVVLWENCRLLSVNVEVYGILFCIESHFVYEIIDDNMGI